MNDYYFSLYHMGRNNRANTIKSEVMTKNVVSAFKMLKNVRHNGYDYNEGKVYNEVPDSFLEDDFVKQVEVDETTEFAQPTDRADIIAAEMKAKKAAKKERQNVVVAKEDDEEGEE